MQTALETALEYAGKGWSVFPLVPGTKFPYKNSHWRRDSTNDPAQVQMLGELYPNSNWALDCYKSGIFVVDIDTAKGAKLDAFKGKEFSTLTIRTPSGGYHLYYKGTGPTGSGHLGPNIDTRGVGGYVLIPGSFRSSDGKTYQVIAPPLKIQPIPPKIAEQLGHIRQDKDPRREIPLVELDQDHNIKRAMAYLADEAPEAIEGQAGDKTTYGVVCKLRDYGLSPDMALQLLCKEDGWNEVKAQPPWIYTDLAHKVRSAYKYAKDRPGNATADVMFPDTEGMGVNGTDSIRRVSEIRLEGMKPRDWLLGYRYLPGYVTLTIAPGGVGKSLFTILEAVSVTSGRMLTGDKVFGGGGAVWLYNTEDPFDELERRFLAVMQHYQIAPSEVQDLYYSSAYKTPMILAAYDSNKRVVVNEKLVEAIISEIKVRGIKLFIVDPLIECHSLTENDNPGMNRVVQIFRRIAFETKCAVSLVHHSSKSGTGASELLRGNVERSRGASAITSAARIAHTLYPMSLKEAKEFGVGEREASWYVRLDDAKSNLGPPIGSNGQRWFKKISVKLNVGVGGEGEGSVGGEVIETTGTLALVEDMVRVVGDDETDLLIVESVTELVGLNENKSVYALSKEIVDVGVIQLRRKTLHNKIENLFGIPIVKAGCVWRLSQVMALNNKPAVSIACTVDEE